MAHVQEMVDGYVYAVIHTVFITDPVTDDEDFADIMFREHNPGLEEIAEKKLTSLPLFTVRCSKFADINHETVTALIKSGACESWFDIGYDLAMVGMHQGVGFTDRNYGDAGEKLSESARVIADAEGASMWTIPDNVSVSEATDIGYEEC